MATPENIETHGRIFGNGLRTPDSPGVDPKNWVFNPDTQNYDYAGPDDPEEIKSGKSIIQKGVPSVKALEVVLSKR